MLERLLDYWYAVEFFQPVYPINAKEDCDLRKNRLPWPPEKSDPKARISYDIYFGHSLVSDCVEWLAGKLSLPVDESLAERSQTSVCLCALKVDENGVYISDSFAVSGFAWALGRLAAAKRFTARIDYIELENLNKKINDDFCEKAAPFTLNELLVVINTVRAKTCIEDGLFTPTLWARKKIQYQKKDGSFPPLNPATELMQSFYIRDIDDIRKNPKYQVENFAESLCGDPPERTLIDSDIVSMRKWLSARYFPKGVWPSEYSPNLMQQLAINLAISGHGIFSVNGPPGTGKTTLLREILACNIVKRASIFAKYKEPDDAFEKMEFANPPDIYSCTYYRPRDDELTEFGVLIATNNNNAAENISTALPAAVTADRTGKFTNLAGIHETYFADVASELLGKPAWGLVSARLGKKENINELKERLWWAGDGITLKRYFLQPDTDWESARRNFIDAMKAVDDERAHIAKAQDLLAQFGAIIENEKRETGATRRCRAEMIDLHRKYKKTQTDSTNLEKELLNLNEGIGLLENSLSWLKRNLTGIFKKDPAVIELSRLKQEREATAMSITRLNAEKRAQNENYEKRKKPCACKRKL